MRENKRVLMGKPHRGFVIYRAGLPSVVRLPCLWNMRESNADGVAFASPAPWQRWRCMPTLPYKKRNRDAIYGLRANCSPIIKFLQSRNKGSYVQFVGADARAVRPYMHSRSSSHSPFYASILVRFVLICGISAYRVSLFLSFMQGCWSGRTTLLFLILNWMPQQQSARSNQKRGI